MRNFYSYAPFARTAVDTLNRVEVLRGPSSVLYGQATNGGIINSVSKTPQFTPEGYVRLEYGSYDRKQEAMDLTGPLNGSGTLAGRSEEHTSELQSQISNSYSVICRNKTEHL